MSRMKIAAFAFAFATFAVSGSADIEKGRDLMEAGKFKEAMAEFEPAARSGNADAEELIGIMYAMGLGVERDDERAFEWYLRASIKAHPGANLVGCSPCSGPLSASRAAARRPQDSWFIAMDPS